MAIAIRRVAYYNTTVRDRPDEGYEILSHLADAGVGLVAFTAVPVGDDRTQLTLFPEEPSRMADVARRASLDVDGPRYAMLVQGDDKLGALAEIHQKLYGAGIKVYASSGVADGRGAFGYVVYVGDGQHEAAAQALGV